LATISGIEVVVGLTGIGPESAATKACEFTWGESLDLCITTGFAGALRPEHQVADILAAREIVADEKRAKRSTIKIKSTERLLRIAANCGAKLVDQFYSSPSLIGKAQDKAALRDIADAVEMESFEVLSEALAWMSEGIAVRAISDMVDEDLPLDFDQMVTEEGELSMARLAGQMVRHPSAIPGLIRLGKRTSEAARRLADFLDSYVAALAGKHLAPISREVRAT
jgi:adenosylhomocysteine nucleosidase